MAVNQTTTVNVTAQLPRSSRSRTTALILCFFLGCLGAHQFYLGKTGMGVLCLFTLGIVGFGALIDFIVLLMGSTRDAEGLLLS